MKDFFYNAVGKRSPKMSISRINHAFQEPSSGQKHFFFTDGNCGKAPEVTGSDTIMIGGYGVHYDGDQDHKWSMKREPFLLPKPTLQRVKVYAIVQALHIADEVGLPATDSIVIQTTDRGIYNLLTDKRYQGDWPLKQRSRALLRNIWNLAAKRRVFIMYDAETARLHKSDQLALA